MEFIISCKERNAEGRIKRIGLSGGPRHDFVQMKELLNKEENTYVIIKNGEKIRVNSATIDNGALDFLDECPPSG